MAALQACPPGQSICGVRGGSFCVTHEAEDPCIHAMMVRAMELGAVVMDLNNVPLDPQPNLVEPKEGA